MHIWFEIHELEIAREKKAQTGCSSQGERATDTPTQTRRKYSPVCTRLQRKEQDYFCNNFLCFLFINEVGLTYLVWRIAGPATKRRVQHNSNHARLQPTNWRSFNGSISIKEVREKWAKPSTYNNMFYYGKKKEEKKKIPRRSQCISLNGKRNVHLFRRLLTARRPNQRR